MKTGSSIGRLLSRATSEPLRLFGCPGSKVNDYLTIDCSECDGPQDLGQIRCLRGCVRAVSEAGEIDHIALSRDVVIEYQGRSAATLQRLSAPLKKSRSVGRVASGSCSKCPIEPSRLIFHLYTNWPPMPPPESFRVPFHQGGGAQCANCRNRTVAVMEEARRDLSAVSLQLNQLSVKVLGGSH